MQKRTSGGSRETDVKELTVVPTARASAPVVMTVTPVTNSPHTRRRFRDSTGYIWCADCCDELMRIPFVPLAAVAFALCQFPGTRTGLQRPGDDEAGQLLHVRTGGDQAPPDELRQHPGTERHETLLRI